MVPLRSLRYGALGLFEIGQCFYGITLWSLKRGVIASELRLRSRSSKRVQRCREQGRSVEARHLG